MGNNCWKSAYTKVTFGGPADGVDDMVRKLNGQVDAYAINISSLDREILNTSDAVERVRILKDIKSDMSRRHFCKELSAKLSQSTKVKNYDELITNAGNLLIEIRRGNQAEIAKAFDNAAAQHGEIADAEDEKMGIQQGIVQEPSDDDIDEMNAYLAKLKGSELVILVQEELPPLPVSKLEQPAVSAVVVEVIRPREVVLDL